MPTIDVEGRPAPVTAPTPGGLSYPPSLIDSLQSIPEEQTSNPHEFGENVEPVRLIPASTFSSLHQSHLLSHPPDSTLFPFMHGIEGDNQAQNTFFRNSALARYNPSDNKSPGGHPKYGGKPMRDQNGKPITFPVPKFRGLIWVLCDDDLSDAPKHHKDEVAALLSRNNSSVSLDDSDDEMSYSDDEEFDEVYTEDEEEIPSSAGIGGMMDVDVDVRQSNGDVDIERDGETVEMMDGAIRILSEDNVDKESGKHMHPVQHRAGLGLQTRDLNGHSRDDSAVTSSSSPESSFFSSSSVTSATSAEFDPYAAFDSAVSQSSPDTPPTGYQELSSFSTNSPTTTDRQPKRSPSSKLVYPTPAILTSSLRPKDVIQPSLASHNTIAEENETGDWEFVPLRVPDGISLRNFGIQVPIYATLSDVVVYSPRGNTFNARRLARRIQLAQHKKRLERADRLGVNLSKTKSPNGGEDTVLGEMDMDVDADLPQKSADDGDDQKELLRYRTFVLDATSEELRRDYPHLVIKMRSGKGVGASVSASAPGVGHYSDISETRKREALDDGNTVNFAVREREEMRDLTRASEILSLVPAPANDPLSSSPEPLQERGAANIESQTTVHPSTPSPAPTNVSKTMAFALAGSNASPRATPVQDFYHLPGSYVSDSKFSTTNTSTHWDPTVGQVFLGNSSDVPLPLECVTDPSNPIRRRKSPASSSISTYTIPFANVNPLPSTSPLNPYPSNLPTDGYGYDVCIECHDMANFPAPTHMRTAVDHMRNMDMAWIQHCVQSRQKEIAELPDGSDLLADDDFVIPPRPPPDAENIIHLPFPSSPAGSAQNMSSLVSTLKCLEKWLRPCPPARVPNPKPKKEVEPSPSSDARPASETQSSSAGSSSRRWSSVTSLFPTFGTHTIPPSSSSTPTPSSVHGARSRSMTSPEPPHVSSQSPRRKSISPEQPPLPQQPTRPLKILIYSSDGYTESSVPALSLLMAIKRLSIPEAYLELQVEKKRSFFVYNNDLALLRRVHTMLTDERRILGGQLQAMDERKNITGLPISNTSRRMSFSVNGAPALPTVEQGQVSNAVAPPSPQPMSDAFRRPAARSVSFSVAPKVDGYRPEPDETASAPTTPDAVIPSQSHMVPTTELENVPAQSAPILRRPRAITSPPSMYGINHQAWFNDTRFDGSFPSRVLPFLYLGNLNHASNVYMLHALGITHVVSVGECALVPPTNNTYSNMSSSVPSGGFHYPQTHQHMMPNPHGQGSLYIEEREGRIKVLDIKGVCDDGIDTLEPQLEPICDWIDQARREGGQVLVHCRVGVSRSATVTIAYVMKHLNIPLVDAYLIVRSRRLSVLIQPNMRLLYNLCGWEIRLAKERVSGDEQKLRAELSRILTWPYLAKEVHALNEKYLH